MSINHFGESDKKHRGHTPLVNENCTSDLFCGEALLMPQGICRLIRRKKLSAPSSLFSEETSKRPSCQGRPRPLGSSASELMASGALEDRKHLSKFQRRKRGLGRLAKYQRAPRKIGPRSEESPPTTFVRRGSPTRPEGKENFQVSWARRRCPSPNEGLLFDLKKIQGGGERENHLSVIEAKFTFLKRSAEISSKGALQGPRTLN